MALLLIVPAWILLMALVAGLCRAARAGDTVLCEQALSERSLREPPGAGAAVTVIAARARPAGSAREGKRSGVGVAA